MKLNVPSPAAGIRKRSDRAEETLAAAQAWLGGIDEALGVCWADVPDDDDSARLRCGVETDHRSGLCSTHRVELCGEGTEMSPLNVTNARPGERYAVGPLNATNARKRRTRAIEVVQARFEQYSYTQFPHSLAVIAIEALLDEGLTLT
jgi:hypothetical protein